MQAGQQIGGPMSLQDAVRGQLIEILEWTVDVGLKLKAAAAGAPV